MLLFNILARVTKWFRFLPAEPAQPIGTAVGVKITNALTPRTEPWRLSSEEKCFYWRKLFTPWTMSKNQKKALSLSPGHDVEAKAAFYQVFSLYVSPHSHRDPSPVYSPEFCLSQNFPNTTCIHSPPFNSDFSLHQFCQNTLDAIVFLYNTI